MLRRILSGLLAGACLFAPLLAHANDRPGADFVDDDDQTADVTHYLALTSGAALARQASITTAFGGYDSAAQSAILNATAELRLLSRLALVAGVSYGRASAVDTGLRPQLGVRLQFLSRARSGLDASAFFLFRQDRFTAEDGLFQGGVALGRNIGDTALVMNLVYAQDGEGDDHEGEVRVAALRRVHGGLHLGLEGRYMHALASTDPKRALVGTPSSEAVLGPVAAFLTGSWSFSVEGGLAMREAGRRQTGAVMLAGIGMAL